MPFGTVPCKVWVPIESEEDAYGNRTPVYAEEPDWEGGCCYSPSRTRYMQTDDDIGDGRPHGASMTLTVYLPKSLDIEMRGARLAVLPPDDAYLSGRLFDVVGVPVSYHRASTPGDFSWQVEAVEHVG